MIYFIPAWGNGQIQGFNTDEMIGPIRSFIDSDEDYRVIVSDYLPELRYFLHRFDLLESNFISLYDELQGTAALDQKKITFKDLGFPEEAYFIYTPFNLLVYQGESCIGNILLGEASQVLEATHILEERERRVDVYDDRGFLAMRKKFEGDSPLYTEVLDIKGEWIFRILEPQGNCIVNAQNTKGLRHRTYESQEELQFEGLDKLLTQMGKEDSLMVSLTNKNSSQIMKSSHLQRMSLSFFQRRFDLEKENAVEILSQLAQQSKNFILDNEVSLRKVTAMLPQEKKRNIHHLTPYDTRFELSLSQELKEEVLYVEARSMEETRLYSIMGILLEYMKNTLLQEENQRVFKVLIRVASYEDKRNLEQAIDERLFESFPKEMLLLEKLPISPKGVETPEMEKIKEEFPLLTRVRTLKSAWEIQVIQNEAEIFKQMHQTRLVIDLSDTPDLFTQVAGISAGIPQINSRRSEYVHHHKNGWVIEDIDQLPLALEYYLETLHHWQEARAYSAQQIKQFSGPQLREKLQKIVGEHI